MDQSMCGSKVTENGESPFAVVAGCCSFSFRRNSFVKVCFVFVFFFMCRGLSFATAAAAAAVRSRVSLLQREEAALLGLVLGGVGGQGLRPRRTGALGVRELLQFGDPRVHLVVVLGLE